MTIQLKKFHIIFCMKYIPRLQDNINYKFLERIENERGTLEQSNEPVPEEQEIVFIEIKGDTLASIWELMGQEPEVFTSPIAREISEGSEGFTGLEAQLATIAYAGDPEAVFVINKATELKAAARGKQRKQFNENLAYLNSLFREPQL